MADQVTAEEQALGRLKAQEKSAETNVTALQQQAGAYRRQLEAAYQSQLAATQAAQQQAVAAPPAVHATTGASGAAGRHEAEDERGDD